LIQVPWAYAYSKWYHQYPQFPIPALTAASLLQEYTLSDRGTYLTLQSQNKSIADRLVLYKRGEDDDPADPLLNPAAVLLGGNICEQNLKLAQGFIDWMVDPEGGQMVVKNFKRPGSEEYLYTMAPDCKKEPEQCAG
jgi:ABC-type tungstate transport system permease subunit